MAGTLPSGAMTVLAASPQIDARVRVQPVLDAVDSRTVWLDAVGQPSSSKLAYNVWVLATVEGIAESLTLARALAVYSTLVVDVIRGSALDSRYVQTKGPRMTAMIWTRHRFRSRRPPKTQSDDRHGARHGASAGHRRNRRGTAAIGSRGRAR